MLMINSEEAALLYEQVAFIRLKAANYCKFVQLRDLDLERITWARDAKMVLHETQV